jgi:hypothetical protein
MSGTGASLNDKIDLAPWGSAPGHYLFTCIDCSQDDPRDALHVGAKRASRCIRHALEVRQREIRTLQDDHREPEELVAEAILQVYDDTNCRALFIGAIIIAAAIVGALIFLPH